MTKHISKKTTGTFFAVTPYVPEDGAVDGALIDAFVEHSKATGAYFDITPYERPDGSLDDAWIDACLEHSARRAAKRMNRPAAKHDDDE